MGVDTENGNARKKRQPYSEMRSREYLTEGEVGALVDAAGKSAYPVRNKLLILLAYNHGLRASELLDLKWDAIAFEDESIFVKRTKGGIDSVQDLSKEELHLLKRLAGENKGHRHLFISRQGLPMSTSTFRKLISQLGAAAGIEFSIHPHMLRHSCGFRAVEADKNMRKLQIYLGHKSYQNTLRYSAVASVRGFWD
jgi:type 1 fimbriae regulatory protein FimB/type 1 fimbriae regulatory protein FimE